MDTFILELLGYQSDDRVPRHWQMALKTLIVVAMLGAGAVMVAITHRDPRPTRGNIHVVAALDDFTEDAGPTASNTMPAFLALPGAVGVLAPSSDLDEPVQAIDESELRGGFCTRSVARQIRHQYPGYYDSWSDDKLESVALEKYPEMRQQLCTLSYKIDATPAAIVKYELKPPTIVKSVGLWLLTLLVTGAVGLACLNLYYRLLVDRLTVWN